jgi:hypothetical protein
VEEVERRITSGERNTSNPSAGMIRIRFDGSAFASQPTGHPVEMGQAYRHPGE